jgi:molybdopterin converting factor small subunit
MELSMRLRPFIRHAPGKRRRSIQKICLLLSLVFFCLESPAAAQTVEDLSKQLNALTEQFQEERKSRQKLEERVRFLEKQSAKQGKEHNKVATPPAKRADKSQDKTEKSPTVIAVEQVLEKKLAEQRERFDQELSNIRANLNVEGDDSEEPKVKISGYLDLGFFAPFGDGRGFQNDVNNLAARKFPGQSRLFLGDPWTTAINSRNEPADTDDSLALPFDNINSGGRSSFIVNEINLNLFAVINSKTTATASVDFLPRFSGQGELGDFIDVDLAFLHWGPFDRGPIHSRNNGCSRAS